MNTPALQSSELPTPAETVEALKWLQDHFLEALRILETPAGIAFRESQEMSDEDVRATARTIGGITEVAIKQLERLAAQPAEGVSGWRPIESAPRDGHGVWLATSDGKNMRLGWWSTARSIWMDLVSSGLVPETPLSFRPSLWHPVPAAPSQTEVQG